MLGDNPVIEAVKAPVVPLAVALLPAVVGVDEVDQHTPRSVTVAPPSEVTLPRPVAVVEAIVVTD